MKRLAGALLACGAMFVGAALTLGADSASAYKPPRRVIPKSRVLRPKEKIPQVTTSSTTPTTTTKTK